MCTLLGHFSAFCAEATPSKDKIFTFAWLKVALQTNRNSFKNNGLVKEWTLIGIVCRLGSCSMMLYSCLGLLRGFYQIGNSLHLVDDLSVIYYSEQQRILSEKLRVATAAHKRTD